jgi:long-chain acyl-CoA synthetase
VDDQPAESSFTEWQHCVSQALAAPLPAPTADPDTLAYLNFTTGTSGFPKGALCSHANIYWNSRAAIDTFQLTAEDVHLCMFASFAHPHELFSRALYSGGSLVLLTRISPKVIVSTINRYRVTCMMGLAVMYKMMAEHCPATALPDLRIAESGGMFTSPEIHTAFLSAFKLPILSVWGSTETTGIALANRPDDYKTNGSMGRPCPGYEVKLIDEAGNEVAAGEVGELLFSSPANVSGYADNIPLPGIDSWYASGDLAKKDQDGFYYFIERKTGMIKVAGLKVYPLQVELVLQQHPAIKEAAVIGVREKRRGYVPGAFVVSEDGSQLDWDEVTRFCKKRLAPYMIPKQFILMDELPKIGSGKINKKALPCTD